MHYTIWIMHYTLRSLNYALYIKHYTLDITQSRLCTIHYALYFLHYALYIKHYTLCITQSELCTTHYALYFLHYALCPPKWDKIQLLLVFLDFTNEMPIEFGRAFTKMKSGFIGGVRVQLGDIDNFISTSCVTSLDWLKGSSAGELYLCIFLVLYLCPR